MGPERSITGYPGLPPPPGMPTGSYGDLSQGAKDAYSGYVTKQLANYNTMSEFAPWAMGIDMAANTILGGVQAYYQGKMVDAQLSYMNHVKTLQTTGLNAEISHRSELLNAQKELTVLGYGTAERLAQIQSKKEVKLAEIASDTKKSLYNSQARQQLFLRTRFYGKPVATSGTALV